MNMITILLCALANQVTSQTSDIYPARILAQQKTISENSDLYLTCSTFGFKAQILVFVYLCKDGVRLQKTTQKPDQNDTTFIIFRVGLDHSGNYSCVYSKNSYLLNKVGKRGHNMIQILVISNFLPGDISVAGPSTVSEGDDVTFRCTVSDALQTLGECQLIQSYLRRNKTILQVQAFNIMRMETTFTIEGAVVRDSGHYSCLVLPSQCIQEHEKALPGNNAVLLEVKVNWLFRVIVHCGALTLMLLLGLFVWWLNKQARYSAKSHACVASQQANADMVGEQQVQTEGEDLESQDGDSFSMEDKEEYHNAVTSEDFTYSDDCEGVYSNADDLPVRPNPAATYSTSRKLKTHQIQCSPDFNLSFNI